MTFTWKKALAWCVALFAASVPAVAWSCGGFFCDQPAGAASPPIAQATERIIFVEEGDEVSAYVQIQYTGFVQNFAWVVPAPVPPSSIEAADPALFDAIDAATAPTFTFLTKTCSGESTTTASGDAGGGLGCGGAGKSAAAPAGGTVDDEIAASEVKVLGTQSVGPYESVTIAADDAGTLRAWLLERGYVAPASAEPILQQYADARFAFVAFRLRPEPSEEFPQGTITPIVLRYRGVPPCIPLRITAIATVPVLEVVAFFIGEGAMEAENYPSLDVDLDGVRPLFAGTDLTQRVLNAADRVGGRGFVTTFAGPSRDVGTIDRDALAILRRGAYVTRLYGLVRDGAMTLDPTFRASAERRDVPLIRTIDLRGDPAFQPFCGGDARFERDGGGSCDAASAASDSPIYLAAAVLFVATRVRRLRARRAP